MKIVLLVGISFFTICTSSWAQQKAPNKPSVSVLLTKLQSQSEVERSEAFEALRSNPAALQSSEMRAALLDLLDRENQELDAKLLQAQNSSREDKGDAVDEGYAEYYSNVLGVVDSIADWNDPRQACILVNAGSSPASAFAAEVARHGKTTIPCLIRRSQSEVDANRSVAVPMLVQALATQKNNLDSDTVETAHQTILKALRDPHVMLRSFTVAALSTFGEADMIPMLKDVAKTDPEFSKESNSYWIRVAANKAVSAIEQRTSKQP
jgi:hypothetical protein